MNRFTTFILLLILASWYNPGFKDEQLKFYRVKSAYIEKSKKINRKLSELNLKTEEINLYFRVFKQDSLLEIWGRNGTTGKFKLIDNYKICELSGQLGPKRKQGDKQIPEGYYHINVFNPESRFHLSLGINYPNNSDLKLSSQSRPGGDIYLHGHCVTIGCVTFPVEDIKEIYVYALEAKNNGQLKIPITIFPGKFSENELQQLKASREYEKEVLDLWDDLKLGYDYFNENKTLPSITFLSNGRHLVK